MVFEINSETPLPVRTNKDSVTATFRELCKGESILIGKHKGISRNSIYTLAKRAKIKITSKQESDGLRVWRVDGELRQRTAIQPPDTSGARQITGLDVRSYKLNEIPPVAHFHTAQCQFHCDAPETLIDEEPMTAEEVRKAKIAELKMQMSGQIEAPQSTMFTEPVVETWIEDAPTYENGQKLYWHHRPKEKPICYKQETDFDNIA